MSLDVRPAVSGDEALLARLNAFVQELHLEHRPDHFKPTEPAQLATWYRSLLQKQTTRIWIARQNDVPVGYLLAILHEAPDNAFVRTRRWCEIDQVAVDPSCRRRGVARALVGYAVAWAQAEGIVQIETASWSFNDPAHEMFRGLGFVPKTIRFELKSRR